MPAPPRPTATHAPRRAALAQRAAAARARAPRRAAVRVAAVASVPRLPPPPPGVGGGAGAGVGGRPSNADAARRIGAAPPALQLVGASPDGVALHAGPDGAFALVTRDGKTAVTGHVTLAGAARGAAPRVERGAAGALADAVVVWPTADGKGVAARLRAVPPGGEAWTKGLSQGVVLEASVPRAPASATRRLEMAELRFDLAGARWYGGPHMMRQLWPADRACLETGPLIPHDNGPTGLNTLTVAQWVTSTGVLIVADDETPFLHVGLNAPALAARGGGTTADGGLPGAGHAATGGARRSWGVGVQNMTREYLPREAAVAGGPSKKKGNRGDGQLRLQARASYRCPRVSHPLADWLAPADGEGGGSLEGALAVAAAAAAGGAAAALAAAAAPLDDGADASNHAPSPSGWLTVRAAVCAAGDARAAAAMGLAPLVAPGRAPSRDVLEAPIWTTWARYFSRVTQADVLAYAREIVARGLPRSVLEIDDRWQSAYGDLAFDPAKFPDPRAMVQELTALGFKVTVWVMPFVEERSAAYAEGKSRGFFVESGARRPPWLLKRGFFRWWNAAPVVALDVTNPAAVAWFTHRLAALQAATGVHGFKFDAGEPCFLPASPRFASRAALAHPAHYTRLYVRDVAGRFAGGVSEVRTGHRTQDVALLTRMGDRFSTWDVANGLRSMVPTLLTSGLAGYPFTLPDMVGGNAYFGRRPDTELMVRWAQANALMPAIQFSIPPWDCSPTAADLVAAALRTRARFAPLLHALADAAAATLTPMARPLWWLAPQDAATHGVDDAFALGDDVVVAPVVDRGAVARDVYLPAGHWRDADGDGAGPVIEGGRWLRAYPAPLDKLPVFVRAGSGAPGAGAAP